jgi:hypothetical protein
VALVVKVELVVLELVTVEMVARVDLEKRVAMVVLAGLVELLMVQTVVMVEMVLRLMDLD